MTYVALTLCYKLGSFFTLIFSNRAFASVLADGAGCNSIVDIPIENVYS